MNYKNYAIELRNGSYFQDLDAKNGGPIESAREFSSREEAESFMQTHQWILFHGGMAVSIRSNRTTKNKYVVIVNIVNSHQVGIEYFSKEGLAADLKYYAEAAFKCDEESPGGSFHIFDFCGHAFNIQNLFVFENINSPKPSYKAP